MNLSSEQVKDTARAFVDESVDSSVLGGVGFGFQFDPDTGRPVVVEWEPDVFDGQIFEREKATGILEWLSGIATMNGLEVVESDIRRLATAIVEQIHYGLGMRGEV